MRDVGRCLLLSGNFSRDECRERGIASPWKIDSRRITTDSRINFRVNGTTKGDEWLFRSPWLEIYARRMIAAIDDDEHRNVRTKRASSSNDLSESSRRADNFEFSLVSSRLESARIIGRLFVN